MAGSRSLSKSWLSESSSSSGGVPTSVGEGHGIVPPFVPDTIGSKLGMEDLSLIRARYGILTTFELEPPGPSGRVSSPFGKIEIGRAHV